MILFMKFGLKFGTAVSLFVLIYSCGKAANSVVQGDVGSNYQVDANAPDYQDSAIGDSGPDNPKPKVGGYQKDAPWPNFLGRAYNRRSSFAGPTELNNRGTYQLFTSTSDSTTSPVIDNAGTIYIGDSKGKLTAFTFDGTKWEVKATFDAGNGIYSTPAIDADGVLYFGSEDQKVYAVKLEGNAFIRKGEFVTGGPVYSSPAIGPDGTVYIGGHDKKVYALEFNGTSLEKKADFVAAGEVDRKLSIDKNGIVYVVDSEGVFYALQLEGANLIKKAERNLGDSSSLVIDDNGTIFVSVNRVLYALLYDGSQIQQKAKYISTYYLGTPVIAPNGDIHAPIPDGGIHTLRYSNGTLTLLGTYEFLIRSNTGEVIAIYSLASPLIVDSNGTVFVGAGPRLYALVFTGTSLTPATSFTAPYGMTIPPVISANGLIFTGSVDGKLYALGS